jgi:hypothetical protein
LRRCLTNHTTPGTAGQTIAATSARSVKTATA